MCYFFFFFKQKTAYEIMPSLVGSEMCIRDRGRSINDFSEDEIMYYADLINAKPSLDIYFRSSSDILAGRTKSVQIDIAILGL